MATQRERRVLETAELRALPDKPNTVGGYAARFNSNSVSMGRFVERIAHGAFTETLKNEDVRALWNHDTAKPLGRTSNQTLRLFEDGTGLGCEIDLPDTSWGQDAAKAIARRDVTGMSFGFDILDDHFERGKDGEPHIRTILKVKLYEVSPVTFPAYEATSIGQRDLTSVLDELDAFEEEEEEEEKRYLMRLRRKKLTLARL